MFEWRFHARMACFVVGASLLCGLLFGTCGIEAEEEPRSTDDPSSTTATPPANDEAAKSDDAKDASQDEPKFWGDLWIESLGEPFYAFEKRHGVDVDLRYTGQTFKNTHGGLRSGPLRYRNGTDLVITLDTAKHDLWEGGKFYVYGFTVHGKSLTPREIGDYQFYSNFESFPKRDDVTQIGEWWYQHTWADGALVTKIGQQDGNVDFAKGSIAHEFINSAFNTIAPTPVPTWPLQTFGVFAAWTAENKSQVKFGVYDGRNVGAHYFLPTVNDRGTVFAISELVCPMEFGDDKLPGAWRIGGWYHTGEYNEITTGTSRILKGNAGVYVEAEQLLWRENSDEGDEQGLSAFVQYGWAPGDRNPPEHNYAGGLIYHGLLPQRDRDALGLGWSTLLFGRPTRQVDGQTFETAVELFYRAVLSDHVSLQPEVQYIANPGGDGRDALAVGLQFILVL
ncbi:MAG: carbohydrate porin [Planctomycetaceae bacterium]|nr:carbohydrate porin [Planctomycetaceae bacterium]